MKYKSLTQEQMQALARQGKDGRYYRLVRELPESLLVQNIETKLIEVVRKQ